MNEFMDFYFDWGILISGLLIFAGGYTVGWFRHKERCEKLMHAERVRLAITSTIPTGKAYSHPTERVMLEDAWDKG